MTAKPRQLREQRKAGTFTEADNRRIAEVCIVLGTSIPEFIHFAVMQSVSEVEGTAAEMSRYARRPSRQAPPREVREA